jgi:hypothetical protein
MARPAAPSTNTMVPGTRAQVTWRSTPLVPPRQDLFDVV